jgi:hypothetical protein
LLEQDVEALDLVGPNPVDVAARRRIPVAAEAGSVRIASQHVPGRDPANGLEVGLVREWPDVAEMVDDDRQVDSVRDSRLGEKRVDRVGQEQGGARLRAEERVGAEPVAHSQDRAPIAVADHDRTRAEDPVNRVLAPLLVCAKHDARVIPRRGWLGAEQLQELGAVVQEASEQNGRRAGRRNGVVDGSLR